MEVLYEYDVKYIRFMLYDWRQMNLYINFDELIIYKYELLFIL